MGFEVLSAEFASEALELLDSLEQTLLLLESAERPARAPLIASARRGLHTLKGNSGMVGASALQAALHAMEDCAAALETDPDQAAALLQALDAVRAEATAIAAGREVTEASAAIRALATGLPLGPVEPPAAALPALASELRLPQVRIDQLVAAAGDLVVQNGRIQALCAGRDDPDPRALRNAADRLDACIRTLHEQILRVRTVPVGQLLSRFRRLVRDEARANGKRARLVIVGDAVEADKAVLDQLSGALAQLVRNAIAHGIESPEQRLARGKPAVGTVTLSAAPSGDRIELSVADDGAGLDRASIIRHAAARGLPGDDPSSLIFEPGFTTSALSASAGRGVGLDVVKRAVYQFGGTIEVQSAPGAGTRFLLRVPNSIALQRALLFTLGSETWAIPVASVVEAIRLDETRIRWLGAGEALEHRGGLVPMVDGPRLLGTAPARGAYALLVQAGGTAALRVDELLGQQDFVFQPLDSAVRGRAPASAAALLGDGQVVLRLDPDVLVAATTAASRASPEVCR